MQYGTSCMMDRWQTAAVISDTRGRHGLPPVGAVNRYHLQPQAPHWWAKKRALRASTTRCGSHLSGNTPTLQLPLPNAPGTTYTCLITITSQAPVTRSSLHHLLMGPCCCQVSSNQALAISPANCLHLPGSTYTP